MTLPDTTRPNGFLAPHYTTNPLAVVSHAMPAILDEVVSRTCRQLGDGDEIEEPLQDALFRERKRLEKSRDSLRDPADHAFWKQIAGALVDSSDQASHAALLEKICRYHAQEIAGNFNERVYRFATAVVPRGLSWLLQALSWRSFRGMFQERIDLRRKIHIQGQLDQLAHLSQKGTLILVPTHFSNLDSLLVGWAIHELGLPPFCYGAGLNLFSNPVFGYFMNNLGAYKVDRQKKHALYKQVLKNYSTVILESGCHSLFFPGAGRSRSGAMEQHLKLGLLGTGLDAYVHNLQAGKANSDIFVVPCVLSYHFVLEAATLIEDFLEEQGKHRYIIMDDESWKPKVVAQFFYKFFRASSSIHLNFGQPLDLFGNLVNEDGMSIGPNGATVDRRDFVKSGGEIKPVPQRDAEYTRILGTRIAERYRRENIALTSHFVAYAYFEYLKRTYGYDDPYRVFRLDEHETAVSFERFEAFAAPLLARLHALYETSKIQLEPALRSTELRNIVESAERNMGVFHSRRPLRLEGEPGRETLRCEDTKLLFYYHNRMLGYSLDARAQAQTSIASPASEVLL